jgi:flagellar biosynthesis protein FlhG
VLVHAEAADLARLFGARALRPVLLAADHPESLTHAYASLKLLARRCRWLSCDLLLVAPPRAPRLEAIAASLSRCADLFLGAALADWAVVDPQGAARAAPGAALCRIVDAQLRLDELAAPSDLRSPPPAAGEALSPPARH